MGAALAGFAQDAISKSGSEPATQAFKASSAVMTDTLTEDEALLTFASEAAFAAAARTVLADDAHLGQLAGSFQGAFPHIYGSPLCLQHAAA